MNNLILTGKKLKTYVDNMNISDQTSRNFVKNILSYCRSDDRDNRRILMISGLKGTGTTTGILHSIRGLNDYNNTVYISFDRNDKVIMSDLYELVNKFRKKKYIFIDEATVIQNLSGGANLLYDKYVMEYNFKLVLSGTDSLLLHFSNANSLYHRSIIRITTFISYRESLRTANFSFNDYLKMGGLYRADSIKDISGLGIYLDTFVVNNIYNSISKVETNSWDRGLVRTAVYKIIYAVIFSLGNNMSFNLKKVYNFFDFCNDFDVHKIGDLKRLGIVNDRVGRNMIIKLFNFLVSMGVVIEVSNTMNISDKKYYVTNPSIVNIVYSSIIREIKEVNTKNESVYNQVLSVVFKSAVMCHAYYHAVKKGNHVFYYRRNDQEEIDLVEEIVDENPNKDSVFHLYKVEFTDNDTDAKKRADWLFKEEIAEYFQNIGILGDRKIIYLGSTNGLFKNGEEFLLERS